MHGNSTNNNHQEIKKTRIRWLENILIKNKCEEMIDCCHSKLKFHEYQAGKNLHGIIQLRVQNIL